MKKKIIAGLLVFALIVALTAGFVYSSYSAVGQEVVPLEAVSILQAQVQPSGYTWSHPVLNGLTYKMFYQEEASQVTQLGVFTEPQLQLQIPDGYEVTAQLSLNASEVYSGEASMLADSAISEEGEYLLALQCTQAAQNGQAYGTLYYSVAFSVEVPEPQLLLGRQNLQQGDIFTMQLINPPQDVIPELATELGMAVFSQMEDGSWFAAVPIGNSRAVGSYDIAVSAGELSWSAAVTVEPYAFGEQNLIIDTTSTQITEANSAEAYAEYHATIPPLFDTYDQEIYWQDVFVQPVEGSISPEFGVIRYTNSDFTNPRYHYGIDYAVGTGTPIQAPNGGRVVLAEFLLNTGGTVVIEHGSGLKSYYYHMDEIYVQQDAIVQQGDIIGTVGSTGYSTGPHLHFEMRIGDQAINPSMLYEQSGGLFSLQVE